MYVGDAPGVYDGAYQIIGNVTYNIAGQMTEMVWFANPGSNVDPHAYNYGGAYERREYNFLNQLTRIYSFQLGQPASMDLNYTYAAGTNNGQISGMTDAVAGQSTTYGYDALKRLAQATTTGGAAWSAAYTYDGFGNLTGKTGPAPWNGSVDPLTNRINGHCYDANGNHCCPRQRGVG